MIHPVNLDIVEVAYQRLNKSLDVGEALLLCNYIEPLIAEIKELRTMAETWSGHEWRVWDKDNPPSEDDVAFVAFRNLVSGEKWVQTHAIIEGQFWYDNEPYAWLSREVWPKPPELHGASKGY